MSRYTLLADRLEFLLQKKEDMFFKERPWLDKLRYENDPLFIPEINSLPPSEWLAIKNEIEDVIERIFKEARYEK